ncbi:type II secretion system protein GspD [Magnetococcales bacterium HHB-1]
MVRAGAILIIYIMFFTSPLHGVAGQCQVGANKLCPQSGEETNNPPLVKNMSLALYLDSLFEGCKNNIEIDRESLKDVKILHTFNHNRPKREIIKKIASQYALKMVKHQGKIHIYSYATHTIIEAVGNALRANEAFRNQFKSEHINPDLFCPASTGNGKISVAFPKDKEKKIVKIFENWNSGHSEESGTQQTLQRDDELFSYWVIYKTPKYLLDQLKMLMSTGYKVIETSSKKILFQAPKNNIEKIKQHLTYLDEYSNKKKVPSSSLAIALRYLDYSGSSNKEQSSSKDDLRIKRAIISENDLILILKNRFPHLAISHTKGLSQKTKTAKKNRSEKFIFSDQIHVVTLQSRNMLLIHGTPKSVNDIKTYIKTVLDVPAPLIELEVIILNGSVGLSEELGTELALARTYASDDDQNKLRLGVIASGFNADTRASSLISNASFVDSISGLTTSFATSFLYRGRSHALAALIRTLESDNKARTISRPRVTTLNNQQATIKNTNDVTVILSTYDDNGTERVSKTVEAGLTIDVIPRLISQEADPEFGVRLVQLSLKIENTTPSVSTDNTQISESGQTINSQVLVPEESTFILGGLYSDSTTDNQSGIPFFKDIPLLGYLFGSTEQAVSKTETVFLITPRIHSYDSLRHEKYRWLPHALDHTKAFSSLREGTQQQLGYLEEDE